MHTRGRGSSRVHVRRDIAEWCIPGNVLGAMKRIALIAPLWLGLCGGQAFGQPTTEPRNANEPEHSLPDRAMSKFASSPLPLWLSARAVATEEGKLDWTLLRATTRSIIERGTQSSTYRDHGCLTYGPVDILMAPGIQQPSSLADLASMAVAVLEGTVVSMTPGFYDSRPGLLLEISVDSWIAAPSDVEKWQRVYVFYPRGNFTIGAYSFCAIEPKLPPAPGVGDRVVLAPVQPPADAFGQIVFLYFEEIFIQSADGPAHVPPRWKRDLTLPAEASFARLRSRLVQAAAKAGRAPD